MTQRGFVLPITLVLLAVIAVGVALMAHRSDDMRALVAAAQAEQQASADVDDAVAQALWASTVLARRGSRLGSIELDGRPYRTASGLVMRWRDAAALVNLRRAPRHEIDRLLRNIGVDARSASALADALLDYTDPDDLRRLEGAERAEYAAAGRVPPRNANLASALETGRVLGWDQLNAQQRAQLNENTYVGPDRTLNLLTAGALAISVISGADPQVAAELVARRPPGGPIQIESLPDINTSSYLAAGRYRTSPSDMLLLSVCPRQVAWCQQLVITTVSSSAIAPWHVQASVRLPRSADLPSSDGLPLLPDQRPDREPPPLVVPGGGS